MRVRRIVSEARPRSGFLIFVMAGRGDEALLRADDPAIHVFLA
jgi:hypothetical protein